MAIKAYIQCDKCGEAVNAGFTLRSDRVVLGILAEPLNINNYGDRPQRSLCEPCWDDVTGLIDGPKAAR